MGAYDIVRRLGQGGMGTVFVAVQKDLGREVALKLLPRTAASEPALVARFQREMKLIGGLTHPNIVRVFDWGQLDGQLYYAMEWVRGHDLSKEKPGDFARARVLLEQAADAIAYLHERQLYHRDVKPSNFVVAEPAHLTLIDFGLARLKEGTLLTEDGAVVGTLRFLPPEAVQGQAAEAPGDVYALAATAHELIGGQPLIPAGSMPEMIARIVSSQRPQLAGVPPAFAELQKRALAVDPAARPTAAEYRDALRALAETSGTAALRVSRAIPAAPAKGVRAGVTAAPAAPAGAPRALVAALAACLAVNVALVAALMRRAPDRPPDETPSPSALATTPAPAPASAAPPPRRAPGPRADWLKRTPPDAPPRAAFAAARVVHSLRCFPIDRGVYVDVDHGMDEGAKLEIGRWDDGQVVYQGSPGYGTCLQEFKADLEPDTDHFLRVRLLSGELALHDYRFRTLPRSHRRAVDIDTGRPDRTQRQLEHTYRMALRRPDLNYVWAAEKYLDAMPAGEALGLSAISALAREMRWGPLATAVLRHTSRLTGTALHSEGVRNAIECRIPAPFNPIALFPETKDPHLFEAGRSILIVSGSDGFERLLRAIRTRRLSYEAGHDLALNSHAAVLAAARRYEDEPFEVRAALAIALHAIATDEAAALINLKTRHTDIPLAHLGHMLGSMNTPVARAMLLEELEQAGSSDLKALAMLAPLQRTGPFDRITAIVKLARAPSAAVRREALAALVASGSADAIPVFAAALADAHGEVASLAAWALGLRAESIPPATAAGFIPMLRGLCRAQQNITGLAWWALARVEGARVIPELEAELERSARVTDTMGLAWALAELRATSALPALQRVAGAADRARPARDMCQLAADLLSGRTSPPDGSRFVTFPAGLGALRTGILLAPGQSVEIAQRGWWALHPHALTPVDGYEPHELAIVPFVGGSPMPLSAAPYRLIANRRVDLTIAGVGGLATPEFLKDRAPTLGFAVLTVSP